MADVIIKGMEMRSACGGETDCFALDESGDYPMCRITGETRGYTFPVRERRMNNCPLRAGTELERLEKEREMLWRTVERLEKERRWISVEERLPEDSVPVLATYRSYNTGEILTDLIACLFEGTWRYWDGYPSDYDECRVVITHWMPLPEAPGEGRQ